MNFRTNIVLDDELIAQAMARAKVTTKKAAVEAALKAYVRKPDYAAVLALQGKGVIDPEYDPRGRFGLTEAALERRGLKAPARVRSERVRTIGQATKPVRKASKPSVAAGRTKRASRALDAA